MPTFGAAAVVISEGNVLLIKRRDCEAWALPGGNVEAGETVAETAIREVEEETGIEIELTRLVGIYASPRWLSGGNHSVVFAARPLSQEITPQPEEVIESGYFCANQLPDPFVWWHRRWIGDATGRGLRHRLSAGPDLAVGSRCQPEGPAPDICGIRVVPAGILSEIPDAGWRRT